MLASPAAILLVPKYYGCHTTSQHRADLRCSLKESRSRTRRTNNDRLDANPSV